MGDLSDYVVVVVVAVSVCFFLVVADDLKSRLCGIDLTINKSFILNDNI